MGQGCQPGGFGNVSGPPYHVPSQALGIAGHGERVSQRMLWWRMLHVVV